MHARRPLCGYSGGASTEMQLYTLLRITTQMACNTNKASTSYIPDESVDTMAKYLEKLLYNLSSSACSMAEIAAQVREVVVAPPGDVHGMQHNRLHDIGAADLHRAVAWLREERCTTRARYRALRRVARPPA